MTRKVFRDMLFPALALCFVAGIEVGSFSMCVYLSGDKWWITLFFAVLLLVLTVVGTIAYLKDFTAKVDKSLAMTMEDVDNELDVSVGFKKRRFGKYVETEELKKLKENTK